jgi:predicted DNA-binding protein
MLMAIPPKIRISLSVDKDTNDILSLLAKKEGKPVASKVLDMVEFALECEEDRILGLMADKILQENNEPFLSHEEFWKQVRQQIKKRKKNRK